MGFRPLSVLSPKYGNVSAYRRIGVSAFAKHHQFRRDLLVIIAVSKSSRTSPNAHTPTRFPAGGSFCFEHPLNGFTVRQATVEDVMGNRPAVDHH